MKLGICLALVGSAFSVTYPALAQPAQQPGVGAHPLDSEATPSADSASAEPAGYRPLIEQALSAYAASNFGEAKAAFLRAYELFPNARALRGLGMVEFELRNYGSSIGHLSAALTSDVRPLDGTLRTETELLLSRARQYVDRVTLEVEPVSCQVLVDGRSVEVPADGTLLLELGQHAIEFRAANHQSARRVVAVRGGIQQTVRVVLTAEPGASSPAQPRTRATSSEVPRTFFRIGPSGLLAYLHSGMTPADERPNNSPSSTLSDAEARDEIKKQGWDCKLERDAMGNRQASDCTVAIQQGGLVGDWAVTPTFGVFVLPRLAVTASAQFKSASRYGTVLSHVVYMLGAEYSLWPVQLTGGNAWLKGGAGIGEIQIEPPAGLGAAEGPWVQSGLGNVHAGAGVDYRFDPHFGFFAEGLAHFMFPDTMLALATTAGLETAW